MARVEVLSSAMLIMAVATLPASPQESDGLGSGPECICPKEGRWDVQDLDCEMSSSTSQMGITCDFYRPFELTFVEALSEDQYQKWEKRIVKKMETMKKK